MNKRIWVIAYAVMEIKRGAMVLADDGTVRWVVDNEVLHQTPTNCPPKGVYMTFEDAKAGLLDYAALRKRHLQAELAALEITAQNIPRLTEPDIDDYGYRCLS